GDCSPARETWYEIHAVLYALLQYVPDDLTGPPDAFFIGVGIHPQRDRRVAMAQLLRHADHIGPVDDCDRGGAVTQLVGVEVFDVVSLAEFLKVPGRALGVH